MVDQCRRVAGTGFGEYMLAVAPHGFVANKEFFGDLVSGKTLHDEAKDLDLPDAERVVADGWLAGLVQVLADQENGLVRVFNGNV